MMRFIFSAFLILFSLITPALAQTTDPKQDALAGLPKLYSLSPTTGIVDTVVWYSAKVSDNELLKSCQLFVDGKYNQNMTVKYDVTIAQLSLKETGPHTFYIKCTDTDDHVVIGKDTTVTITSGSSHVNPGDLIKMGCPPVVYPNHPCTAVYYFGVDGKRHAFPNESVYKTWFKNFSDIVIISVNVLSDIPLGKNVTYRPGNRLVKFSTSTVYGVSYAGFLRPMANAEIVEALFGANWVSLIEGVDDVFFSNYRIGYTVESSNNFNWKSAQDHTNTIDKLF